MKTKCLPLALAASCRLFLASHAFAQAWTQTGAPTNNWTAVASSADGSKLVAAVKGGPIYISPDSGATWTATSAPSTNWSAVTSSADGTKLVATVAIFNGRQYEVGGPIYVSADSGATWTAASVPDTNWASIACSADGSKLVAVTGGDAADISSAPPGPIFTSTDSGATWTATSVTDANCISVASSADGSKLVAVGFGGLNYTSSDSGATWISSPGGAFVSVASSADGTKLVAGVYRAVAPGGSFFFVSTSTNCGATWTVASLFGPGGRCFVASSADGTKLVAAVGAKASAGNGGPILVSTDSGASWTFNDSPSTDWSSVASSADGSKLVAVVNGGGIWTLHSTPTPVLSITPSGSNVILSWIVPSVEFVLQENSALGTTNWTTVTTPPTLNLTSLQNQVMVSPSSGHRFYRLKH